jgi:hypothetical protein
MPVSTDRVNKIPPRATLEADEDKEDLFTRVLNTLRGRFVFKNQAIPISLLRCELVGVDDDHTLMSILKELESKGLVTIQMADGYELGVRLRWAESCLK